MTDTSSARQRSIESTHPGSVTLLRQYVNWLAAQNYAARSVFIRVPLLIQFGDSAQRAGVKTLAELPAHVEPFVNTWLGRCGRQYSEAQRQAAVRGVRGPIQQMLRLTVPQPRDANAAASEPFADTAPGFFEFLRRDRGLRETTLVQYRHYLRRFQDYLRRVERPFPTSIEIPSAIAESIHAKEVAEVLRG